MSSIQKWFLAIASLCVLFFGTFLIVYDQPKSQANQLAKLKLETPLIEEADARNSLAFIEKGFYEDVSMENNENSRIDILREYFLAMVNVDEYNVQQDYKGQYSLMNKPLEMTDIIGVLMTAKIDHDTTTVIDSFKDYVDASKTYQNLIVSPDVDITREEQKEIEDAQAIFESKSEALISVVDQLYSE